MSAINLTVCNVSLYAKFFYLPYLYARLRTYIEIDFNKNLDLEWQAPICHCPTTDFFDPKIMLNDIDIKKLDVFIMSNYVWNHDEHLAIAKYIKKHNPNCYIIAGGPEVNYKKSEIFELLPNVDAVSYGEVELIMPTFLYNMQNNLDIDIDGVILKTNPTKQRKPVPKIECKDFKGKPYTHMYEELKKYDIPEITKKSALTAILETNRGCPYSCTFCDWGSATNSKIKKFDKQYVLDEIDSILKLNVTYVMVADANFGIFSDDLDYILKFTNNYKNTGHRCVVSFQSAKNRKDIATKATLELHKVGLIQSQQIGIQHTDEEVLKIMDRDNIKSIESIKEITDNLKHGIPTIPALIIGCPGDTVAKWKTAITDMMKMSFHEEIKIHDYQLLPNAPAMDPEYIKKYKIGYIEKKYPDFEFQTNGRDITPAKYVAECFSFTKQDYAEMLLYQFYYQAVHLLGPFKWSALFAYHTLDIEYIDFYDRVFKLPSLQNAINNSRKILIDYVLNDKKNKLILYDGKNIRLDSYIYLKIIENIDMLLDEFSDEFAKDLKEYTNDLIKFSKFMMVSYLDTEYELYLDYNFKKYFSTIMSAYPYQKCKEEIVKQPTLYKNNGILGTEVEGFRQLTEVNTSKETFLKFLDIHGPHRRNKMFYFQSALRD